MSRPPVDVPLGAAVGENLRRLRRDRGVSLEALAASSGVSRATLATLEAGRGNPTLGTLNALCSSLGVSLGAVLENTGSDAVVVVPARERGAGADGLRAILQLPRPAFIELNEFELAPDRTYEGNLRPGGTLEHMLLVDGDVELDIDGATIALERGDYVRFPADRPHAYRAKGGPARAILLMDYSA